MTPRLILLNGPAADEVAEVFRDGLQDVVGPPGCVWWDEVRDYWHGPDVVSGGGQPAVEPECGACDEVHPCKCARDTEQAIRALPGGEEWLVGLVLPANNAHASHCWTHETSWDWTCAACRSGHQQPARLAILAPDPPPLLVERVRAWGGEMWHCKSYPDGWCYVVFEDGGSIRHMSWPEAVRAALGEAL